MGSIDAAVDAGSRRVGTDMVRNAGKGEKEERVWRRMAVSVSSPNWIE